MYLGPPTDKYWAVDIETNGLTPTKIWCAVLVNIVTQQEIRLVGHNEIFNWFNSNRDIIIVGHNFLSFDGYWLEKLLGIPNRPRRIVDTMHLSYLYDVKLEGGHSLEAWGSRLKFEKLRHENFDVFSPEMLSYCSRDAHLTRQIYLRLSQRMRLLGYTEKCCEIEHYTRFLLDEQERNGFWFDEEGAILLQAKLQGFCSEIESSVRELFPPVLSLVKTIKYRTKPDGQLHAATQRAIDSYPKTERFGDELLVYDYVDFNLGSPKQRTERLLSLGWKPTKLTPKGAPSIDEDSLVAASEELQDPRLGALADWIVYNSRANMIGTWLSCYNPDTHCIHGKVITNGAGGGRMAHNSPNTANIPGVRIDKKTGLTLRGKDGKFTYEARNLWQTRNPAERFLVGVDAKGLELRMLAHVINDPEFTKQVCEGDPHEYNRSLVGLAERSQAKTLLYAIIYGAFPPKIGSIVGGTAKDGERIQKLLFERLAGLERAVNDSRREVERTGRLTGIDGRKIVVHKPHAALNYRLQPAGSIAMKVFNIHLKRHIWRKGLDVLKVGDIHDENQSDVHQSCIDEYVRCVHQAGKDATEDLSLNVPLEFDVKTGKTWAETH